MTAEALYAYDPAGNLQSRSGSVGTVAYTYNADDQLISAGDTPFTYDAAGQRVTSTTGGATTRYGYDARGRLTSVVSPSNAATTYGYDSDGVRMSTTAPTGSVQYLVDRMGPEGLSRVLRETDSSGSTLASYTYGLGLPERTSAGLQTYYQSDALGSVRALTGADGAVTDTYNFTAYGAPLSRAGNSANPYRFTGEPRDSDSGLYYLRARFYDPSVGPFLTRDPQMGDPRQPLTLNKYLYANANPTNVTDPSGLDGEDGGIDAFLNTFHFIREARFKVGEQPWCRNGDAECGKDTGFTVGFETQKLDAEGLIYITLTRLNDGDLTYLGYFGHFYPHTGDYASMWRKRIYNNLSGIRDTLLYSRVVYDAQCNVNDPQTAAWVRPGEDLYLIHVCPIFLPLPRLAAPPSDSKSGVLIHEAAHLALAIPDQVHSICTKHTTMKVPPQLEFGSDD